jgi:flagellar biosynthesis/type III secretory pathway chaperone
MTMDLDTHEQQRLEQSLKIAMDLEQMLEHEFELLKKQQLDVFETRQTEKTRLLNQLKQLTGISSPEAADALGSQWDGFKAQMVLCRNLHRRNELLISRKIDALRGALQSLRIQDPANSIEIYDRQGRIRRNRGLRRYSIA